MPYFWYPGYLRGHWPSNFHNWSAFAAWVQEVMWAPWWTPSPETYPEPSETFKRELFVKIVNGWKPVTIFAKAFKVVKISQIYSNSRLILDVFNTWLCYFLYYKAWVSLYLWIIFVFSYIPHSCPYCCFFFFKKTLIFFERLFCSLSLLSW